MGFAFGCILAVVFYLCPLFVSFVVEQRHEDLFLEQLVIKIFKR